METSFNTAAYRFITFDVHFFIFFVANKLLLLLLRI